MFVRRCQLAKKVARTELNPEQVSNGMTCAESAEGWDTNSVCLQYKVEKIYHAAGKKKQTASTRAASPTT